MPAYSRESDPPKLAIMKDHQIFPTNSKIPLPTENPWKCDQSPPPSSPSSSNSSAAFSVKIAEDEPKTDWRSIYLCTAVTFCCQVQFSLFLNSQFAFMKTLDPSVTEGFFGLVVGGYSFVQMVVTPLVGIWADRIEQVRMPLLVCNAFALIGNLIYFVVDWFPLSWTKWVFMIARLVSGIGPAQNSLLISYATSASVDKDRANATAFITGGIAIGITTGPAFQWLFTYLGYPGLHLFGAVHLDMFTATPIFAILMNVVLHFMLQMFFRESYVGILEKKGGKKRTLKNVASDASMQKKLPPYDRLAVAACCAMRFTQYLTFTNLETIGTSFSMMMFLWTSTQVVTFESFAHTARGLLTLLVYVSYIVFNLGRRLNARIVCFSSLLLLLSFHLITFSWPFLGQDVVKFDSSNKSMPQLGCDGHSMDWCDGLKRVHVWVYYVAIVLGLGIAFPNINVTMNTLFSRMIGPRMQSKEQGLLELFGGMGRMLGPSILGYLYTGYGPRAIWILESAEIGLMILFWLICWNRLVPLKIPKEIEGPKVERKMEQISRLSFAGNLPR